MINQLTYTPYRGAIEPVTEVYEARVEFFPNALEVIIHYEFDHYNGVSHRTERVRQAHVIFRNGMTLERGAIVHELDPNQETVEVVWIYHVGGNVCLKSSEKEANKLYHRIKKWMLSGDVTEGG